MKLKYVGPFDEVEIPDIGAVVKGGDTFEVALPDVAVGLLAQPANFEPADEESEALARHGVAEADVVPQPDPLDVLTAKQLEGVADSEGADRSGLTKKNDLIAAIRAHRDNEGA